MTETDFDVDSLAAYLHLNPAQVQRLVERGKLPGRRVSGHWRFSRSEIHHWLEERIGLSTDDELIEMEGALRRDAGSDAPEISMAELIPIEAIAVPLLSRTRGSVITSMAELAASTTWLWQPDKMSEAVRLREAMLPTALDNGVALLHPRRPLPAILDRAFVALGRTEGGIPFGNQRGVLTDLFFLICALNDRDHLRVLARLSRLISDRAFVEALREAPDAQAAHDAIVQFESLLS